MKKLKKTFLLLVLPVYVAFLFGTSYVSNAYAIDFNDFVLEVKALSPNNDVLGVVPVFVTVTFDGAGVDILTAENFSTNTDAQIVPVGCSALTLDTNKFLNKGDGIYHLGLRPVTALCSGTYYLPIKVDMRPGFGINASGVSALEISRFSFNIN